jgi:hypothetical protein
MCLWAGFVSGGQLDSNPGTLGPSAPANTPPPPQGEASICPSCPGSARQGHLPRHTWLIISFVLRLLYPPTSPSLPLSGLQAFGKTL